MKEDFKGVPSWIDRVIYSFNKLLDGFQNILNNGLSFQDNVRCMVRKFSFETGASYTANDFTTQQLKWSYAETRPTGLWIVSTVLVSVNGTRVSVFTPLYTAVSCDWVYQDGQIEIRYIAGLANSCAYEVTVIVI